MADDCDALALPDHLRNRRSMRAVAIGGRGRRAPVARQIRRHPAPRPVLLDQWQQTLPNTGIGAEPCNRTSVGSPLPPPESICMARISGGRLLLVLRPT